MAKESELTIQGDITGIKTTFKTYTNMDGESIHRDFIEVRFLIPFDVKTFGALGKMNAAHKKLAIDVALVQGELSFMDEIRQEQGDIREKKKDRQKEDEAA